MFQSFSSAPACPPQFSPAAPPVDSTPRPVRHRSPYTIPPIRQNNTDYSPASASPLPPARPPFPSSWPTHTSGLTPQPANIQAAADNYKIAEYVPISQYYPPSHNANKQYSLPGDISSTPDRRPTGGDSTLLR